MSYVYIKKKQLLCLIPALVFTWQLGLYIQSVWPHSTQEKWWTDADLKRRASSVRLCSNKKQVHLNTFTDIKSATKVFESFCLVEPPGWSFIPGHVQPSELVYGEILYWFSYTICSNASCCVVYIYSHRYWMSTAKMGSSECWNVNLISVSVRYRCLLWHHKGHHTLSEQAEVKDGLPYQYSVSLSSRWTPQK